MSFTHPDLQFSHDWNLDDFMTTYAECEQEKKREKNTLMISFFM